MEYPKYAKVNNKKYKINTDFRIAIECNQICNDETICDEERALAVIYKLFGEDGLNSSEDMEMLLKMAKKYLSLGNEVEENDEEPDMDFVQDYCYIKSSFRSDYGINLDNEQMHWWEFYNLINGLSNSEMGNCCVLNRIRNLRNFDATQIKDEKERNKIIKAQESVALKKKEKPKTQKQKELDDYWNRILKKGD